MNINGLVSQIDRFNSSTRHRFAVVGAGTLLSVGWCPESHATNFHADYRYTQRGFVGYQEMHGKPRPKAGSCYSFVSFFFRSVPGQWWPLGGGSQFGRDPPVRVWCDCKYFCGGWCQLCGPWATGGAELSSLRGAKAAIWVDLSSTFSICLQFL